MKFFLKVLFLILIYFSSATADVNFQQKKFYYENLVKNWSKIFPDSNRNAAGPRFFKYLIDQDLTYEEFKEYNKFFVRIMIRWLYLLFCKIGIHRYEKIDINFSFGPGGSTETIKCKDCGIEKIRRKN